jgi:Tol biopolymer transport system component
MTTLWKWLGLVVLMALLSSTIAAEDTLRSDYIKALSPDGTQMLVVSYTPGTAVPSKQSVYLMDMSGQDLYQVFLSDQIISAAWSPDGTEIAVLAQNSTRDRYALYMVNPASGEADRLTEDMPLSYYMSWSPDGQWLLVPSSNNGAYVWERATRTLTPIMEENPAVYRIVLVA